MARINLTGGAYSARSIIASDQICLNLFAENMVQAQGEPIKTTHYPTPGLTLIATLFGNQPIRGLYCATNGDLYAVSGATVYYVAPTTYAGTAIGTLTTSAGSVSMSDNTLTLVIVDGSIRGTNATTYDGGMQVDLPTRVGSPMPTSDNGFYGSDRVEYTGTFFLFNKPNTPQFYCSDSLATTFTSLYFANKSTAADYLVAAVASRGQIWLVGRATTEVWTLSGAADFPFQALQGALIEHGCIANYSIAVSDSQIFFLSLDKQGRAVVLKGSGYTAMRISTNAIEQVFQRYYYVGDAIGYCYQLYGHVFYVLSFPTGGSTWVYDESTSLWHEWAEIDGTGTAFRHRSNCFAHAYDQQICGDYQNGNLYIIDPLAYTDNGQVITRIRSFPHMVDDDKRIHYSRFVADMDVATESDVDPSNPPQVTLTWSDDRGATWSTPLVQSIGNPGQTLTSIQFRRLGMARDRVFKLSWTTAAPIALNGAWIDVVEAAT